MAGLDKPFEFGFQVCEQAFCPNVRLKAWHGGARQNFGPKLGFKFDMRGAQNKRFAPMYKVEGLWWG